MMRHLAREGVTVGRHRVRRLMRLLGLGAGAYSVCSLSATIEI